MAADLVQCLSFYGALLVLKMVFVALWTSKKRFEKNTFANPEDTLVTKGKVDFADQDIERIRRCHLNDLENVLPFLLMAMMYVTISPEFGWARMHFRAFTISRYIHMFSYLFKIPQPARALSFGVGEMVTVSMAVQVIMRFGLSVA